MDPRDPNIFERLNKRRHELIAMKHSGIGFSFRRRQEFKALQNWVSLAAPVPRFNFAVMARMCPKRSYQRMLRAGKLAFRRIRLNSLKQWKQDCRSFMNWKWL